VTAIGPLWPVGSGNGDPGTWAKVPSPLPVNTEKLLSEKLVTTKPRLALLLVLNWPNAIALGRFPVTYVPALTKVPSPLPSRMLTVLVVCEATAKSGKALLFSFRLPAAMETGVPAPPCVAVIETVPAATPVAKPDPPSMVASELFDEAQTDVEVMSSVLPSLYVPVAVKRCDVPVAMVAFGGFTAIDFRVAEVTVNVATGLLAPFSLA